MTHMPATRRDALLGMGGLTLALTAGYGSTAAGAGVKPPVSDLDAYLALRFAGPGRVGWWINRATVFAMVLGRRTVPLFDVIGLGRDNYTALPDGAYQLSFDECGWYCAPGTQTPLDRVTSPINGRSIKVQHYRSPNSAVLRDGRQVPTRPLPPDVELEAVRGPLLADGEFVWITDDLFLRAPRKVSEQTLQANPAAAWNVQTSLATYNARQADLAVRRKRWVPATCAYQTLASWRPWFEADEIPGAMSWRMHGTKAANVAAIPEPLLSLVRAQHPDLLQS